MIAKKSNMSVDNNLVNTMQTVFDKVSEAIDDVRNSRVLLEEDFWSEYDKEDFNLMV